MLLGQYFGNYFVDKEDETFKIKHSNNKYF